MKILILVGLVLINLTFAETKSSSDTRGTNSKSSIGIKYFSASKGAGVLYGWRHVNYMSSNFYLGGAGFTGQMGDQNSLGTYSYGGLVTGYDFVFSKSFATNIGLLAGGGGGVIQKSLTQSFSAGGIVLEPRVGLDVTIGKKVNFNFSLTYIFMPNNPNFSGITGTLRFNFILF